MRVLVVFLISLFQVPGLSAQDAKMPLRDMVRIPSPAPGTSDIYNYVVSVLELTLQVTEPEYGRLTVYSNPQTTPQQRQLMNLANGNTDIAWSITSTERESQYLPVRVPFIGGLFGYRVLLIHSDDERFNYAPALAELKAMTAIQGANWPDTQILQFNEFNVIGSYENGLKLLHRRMVDYYPRAVHEYSQELAENPQYTLKLAPHVGLKYPNPLFFFVNKNNLELAERLTKGLTMLHNNGQLNALLHSQPFYRDADTALSGREIHVLRNPLLTKETLDALSRFQ